MKLSDEVVQFGPWLPDLPDLGNPGLTVAENVQFIDGSYQPYRPMAASGMTALAAEPLGAIEAGNYTYAGTSVRLYRSLTATGTWTDVSLSGDYTTTTNWNFERFDDFIIACNGADTPQYQTLGTGSFADIDVAGTAPVAAIVGKIGRFIVMGNDTTAGYHIQWCAIDDPTDWPVPGSADAQSKQAGEQYLNPEWGNVTAIVGGDQFGIVAQTGGITRLNYIGGDTVFQFDEIEGSRGCFFPKSMVEAGGVWYYISGGGFCRTNGVSVELIGSDVCDNFFWDSYNQPNVNRTYGAVDSNKKMIYWCYQTTAGSTANRIIAYNYFSNRFSYAEQTLNCLISRIEQDPSTTTLRFRAFNASHEGVQFNGAHGTAILTTGEVELNPGGRALVQGVKPLVSWVTGVAVDNDLAIGYRDDQDVDSITYTSDATPNSRSGFSGFRVDSRYHRARLTLVGQFDTADGIELQFTPSGVV